MNTGTQATKEEIQGLLILIKTVSELVQRRNQQRRPLSLEQNLFTLISALMYAMVPTTAYRLLGDGTQSRPGGSCFASKHGDVESQFEQYVFSTLSPVTAQHTHTHNIQILQNGDGSVPSTRIGLLDTRTSKMEKSRSRRSILVSSRGSKTRGMSIHRVSDSRTMCKIRRHRYMDVFNGANTSRTVAVL